ncbi:CpsD/CapB family tyrosine-protein kinase [candidate division KSB1 bacterium]|nr:CpsD/CapB family tyrosine-protein kinase [candidate division KSB1 bacterium]
MKKLLSNQNAVAFQDSAEAVEFRRLEHRLYNNAEWKKRKVFMVTSANLGEGKSTISSFLSFTHAYNRRIKTLLIDCDLHRPRIHKVFALPQENGLAEYFENKIGVNDLLKETAIPTLKIVTAGKATKKTSELMTTTPLIALINSFRSQFDIIILDSPPIIPVSDPLVISDVADGIYLVMKAGHSRKKMVKHAIEMLGDRSEKIVGAVINNSMNVMPYYYNYSYYGRKYKQSSKDEKETAKAKEASS